MTSTNYNAEQISVLEGLEAVRKRPGMYIGNTGIDGLHRCFGEVLDNSVDEYMASHGTSIKTVIAADDSYVVGDDGRGVPVDTHPKTGKSALETIFTVLHAGGKFDQQNYKFSGGLHGVGASVVNALSEIMEIWVLREQRIYYVEFSKGVVKTSIQSYSEEEAYLKFPKLKSWSVWKDRGTVVRFKPDTTIFEVEFLDSKRLQKLLKQTAYLNKGLKIDFIDEKENIEEKFFFPEGLKTFLEEMVGKENTIMKVSHFEYKSDKFQLELALVYTESFKENFQAFTNGIANPEGGTHVTGFKTAFTKLVNIYAQKRNLFKKDDKFTSDDIKEGLKAILSIKMVDAQFTSQSKVKLGSTLARKLTDQIVTDKVGSFLEENPEATNALLVKLSLSMKARLAAKAARESVVRKGVLENLSLPGKLADCSEKDPAKSEIFIVEGDSAGGSAKQGRDRQTQAILALRGKVLNTEKANLVKIMNYEGIKNMIVAFGTGVGERFDIEKLRYHKIILMTDADVDGAHITTLLLTFLYRYMKPLIEEGYVYMARPPLYRVQQGKKIEYVYSDTEKNTLVRQLQKANDKKIEIQRYKGLGEMNANQLWETTMDPKSRLLWQVTEGEAEMANKVFTDLMGADVAPRRAFIEENAMFVEEIDLI